MRPDLQRYAPRSLPVAGAGRIARGQGLTGDGQGPQARRRALAIRRGRDWDEALRRFGRDGLSAGFLAGNAAFLRSGCVPFEKICPTTAKDRRLADAVAIRVVNEGMSTTFLPFDCPQP